MKTSTLHNPVNFEPSQYEIVGYLDNQPPMPLFCDSATIGAAERFRAMLEQWQAEAKRLFPRGNMHRCQHCGQGNVRYVVAARHLPTGDHVCFGDVCVARLGFANHNAFAAANIRTAASKRAAAANLDAKVAKFCEDHPELVGVFERSQLPVHASNWFARDVLGKLRQYGSISERQISSLCASFHRDEENAKRMEDRRNAMTDVPGIQDGRYEVEGTVISVKRVESDFGTKTKMTLSLSNGVRLFVSVPSSISGVVKGEVVRLTADWSVSRDDKHFGFGKRPTRATVLVAEAV